MSKSDQAFRTIREVADWLGVETHVLRFWESKFPQIKPVKRAGGRRYYRPRDMELIGGIKVLLHDQGMTIRGAQALVRSKGLDEIGALAPPLDEALLFDRDLDAESTAWDADAAKERARKPIPPADDSQPGLPFDMPPAPGPQSIADVQAELSDAASEAAVKVEPPTEGEPAPNEIIPPELPDDIDAPVAADHEIDAADAAEDKPTAKALPAEGDPVDASPSDDTSQPPLPDAMDGNALDRLAALARHFADHPGSLPDGARDSLVALAALKDRIAADPTV